MPSWLIYPFILLCTLSLGSIMVLQFFTSPVRTRLELIFAALGLGVGLGGWIALILAEIGIFSFTTLLLTWLATFFILLARIWKRWRGKPRPLIFFSDTFSLHISNWQELLEGVILGAWIFLAAWLFFRPHEYIMGGADAGVYISLGAEIGRNGGFEIEDLTLSAIPQTLRAAFLRPLPANPVASSYLVPGYYVTDASRGQIVPQFYPLHPTWLAVAFTAADSIASGIRSELLMTGLWMTLSVISMYFILRRLSGRWAALLLLIAFSIAALQVWFARYPATEALTQYLLWTGIWALIMWLGARRNGDLWALLSGVMLGSVFLVRIDMLILLPVIVMFIISLWARGWQKINWWFVIPLVLLLIHSLAHGTLLSAPYFYEHIGFGLRILWRSWVVLLLAISVSLLFLILVYYFKGRFVVLKRFQKLFQVSLIFVVILGALYSWFIRPNTGQVLQIADNFSQSTLLLTNHENWLRLGWYISPIGLLFGVVGCCLLIWRAQWKTAVFLAIGLLFSALYLWDIRANPHQIYVMRRYVPAVFPFFIVSGAYFLGEIIKWKRLLPNHPQARAVLGVVMAVLWLAGLAWSARGFISQVDHQGVLEQLLELEEQLPSHSVLIFDDQSPVGIGDFWGTPLKFIFGHDAFTLRQPEIKQNPQLVEMVEIWQNNGRSVFWIGETTWLESNNFPFEQTVFEIQSRRLESSYEHKPQAIVPVSWILPVSQLGQR